MGKDAFALDNRNGRVIETDVRFDGDELVFTPKSGRSNLPTLSDAPTTGKGAYLDFASLRDNAAKETEDDSEDSFYEHLSDNFLSFAAKYGPLFGYAGIRHNGQAEIRESITDWLIAQSVMSSILKLVAFASGDEIPSSEFDNCFEASFKCNGSSLTWTYTFMGKARASRTYSSCLKDDLDMSFTTSDGSDLRFLWSKSNIPPWFLEQHPYAASAANCGDTMFAAAIQAYPVEHYPDVQTTKQGHGNMPLSKLRGVGEIEKEAGALLKIVADRHTGGIRLGYRNFWSDCDKAEEGGYGIVCSCLLSYMWHELAQGYTNGHFRKCKNPKCGVIIAINTETNSSKQFCCKKCKTQANNLKITKQQSRAREAFYQAKTFEEIYEVAFGKAYLYKDSERKKLEDRLTRWIEDKFKKTKKGKAAAKQGAGRSQH